MTLKHKPTISYEVYRPLVRLVVGLIILAIINWILTSLPMVTALHIPWLPVSISAIVSLIIGIIMISLLLTFRRDFVPKVEQAMPGFKELADVAHSATNLAIIVLAYSMFDDAILPFMQQFAWVYPLVFLALAIWPLVMLIVVLIESSGKIADLATLRIAEMRGEVLECPDCHAIVPSNASYCTKCSTKLELVVTNISTTKCSNCGTENRADDIYCLACGAPLNSKQDTSESTNH